MKFISEMTNVDKESYLVSFGRELYQRLRLIRETQPPMQVHDATIGFTREHGSYVPESVVEVSGADFHPIGQYKDKALIVYALAKHTAYGAYDEDEKICLQLTIGDVVQSVWSGLGGISVREKYDRAVRIIEELDTLIAKASPANAP